MTDQSHPLPCDRLHTLRTPCRECPFRVKSAPGWMGNNHPEQYALVAHGETGVSCHLTMGRNRPQQCVGAVLFASNTCKLYRDPELSKMQQRLKKAGAKLSDLVFNSFFAFFAHHGGRPSWLPKTKP